MREKINSFCNLVTGTDSQSTQGHPQITVPHLRLRLYANDAENLARAILEAVQRAREFQTKEET